MDGTDELSRPFLHRQLRVCGGRALSQLSRGEGRGYNLDKLMVHHRPHKDTKSTCSHSHLLTVWSCQSAWCAEWDVMALGHFPLHTSNQWISKTIEFERLKVEMTPCESALRSLLSFTFNWARFGQKRLFFCILLLKKKETGKKKYKKEQISIMKLEPIFVAVWNGLSKIVRDLLPMRHSQKSKCVGFNLHKVAAKKLCIYI